MSFFAPDSLLATLVAAAVLIVPGGSIALAAGARGLVALALAGPFSVLVAGTTGVLAQAIGQPFGVVAVLITALLATVLTRVTLGRWSTPGWARGTRLESAIALATGIICSLVAAAVAFRITAVDAVSQTFDAVFHVNAVASILQTGQASSLFLYRLVNPESASVDFYPSAYHSVAALVSQIGGVPIPLGMNAVWMAAVGFVWAPGSVLLVRALVGGRAGRGVGILVTGVFALGFAAFPYALLSWGTLYPSFLATALLPTGVALLWYSLPQGLRLGRSSTELSVRVVALPAILLALWIAACVFAHPRTLATFAVIAAPFVLTAYLRFARGLLHDGRRRAAVRAIAIPAVLAIVTAAGAVVFVIEFYGVSARPLSDRLNGAPATARQGIWESVVQVLSAGPLAAPGDVQLAPSVALAVLTLLGLGCAVVSRRSRPVLIAFLLLAVLYVLAAGSNSDLAKLATGLWYKDKYRLISAIPVVAVPLAILGARGLAVWGSRLWPARAGRISPATAALTLTAVVALVSLLGPTLHGTGDQVGRTFALPDNDKQGGLLDQDEIRLLIEAESIVPADQEVLGNPWDGSALIGVFGDRRPVFPHLSGTWGADRDEIATRLDEISRNPDICRALDDLRVRYIVADDEKLWNGADPQINYFAGIDRAVAAGLFTEVASEGSARLFRIDQCGPLPSPAS